MRRERGSLSFMFAVVSLFLFSLVLMVTEGGRKLANISLAEDLASEAARAAAATVDVGSIAQGEPRIDSSADGARAEAERVLLRSSAEVALVDFEVGDGATDVRVVVRVSADSILPGFDVSGVASHTARVIDLNNGGNG